ncbi:UDP-N-acetylmuramate dehydrogenase [Faecalispora anaeroviscerum]|uniref:UDP-N-acetylmuramate dehydrogenase n=1 Tax=Faecalispora anaeroviscerum TaxID=2991836 RepID=UPI0024BAD103|nr:UDP-N-acetylmuramate dehydrogenase [Faecalispora anaeroviscerum]
MDRIEQLGAMAQRLGCSYSFHEPMSRHTTFRIGGPADLFVSAGSRECLQRMARHANELEIPYLVVGNGSNLLVSDEGIRGMVMALTGEFNEMTLTQSQQVRCGAGAPLSALCTFALNHSLSGAEFLWGIPGTAGGAAFMNAGAYGGEMKDILFSCEHMTHDGEFGTLTGAELELSYRHSAYSHNRSAILFLNLQLCAGAQEEIRAKMNDLIGRRRSKQPLELPSAGSVFKRPPDHFAGTLIEQCGLKGQSVGGAAVSSKHAGFIVNQGDATCEDVLRLISVIQSTVLKQTGIELECEIRKIGQ